MTALVRKTKGRIPLWYVELLTTVPLCGLQLGWQAFKRKKDFDGIEWMKWSDPREIQSEALDCHPGVAILERGSINVAFDTGGGGNPYFIPTDKGDDPPLYQVYHDVSSEADEIVAKALQLVAKSLPLFFRKAIIAGK